MNEDKKVKSQFLKELIHNSSFDTTTKLNWFIKNARFMLDRRIIGCPASLTLSIYQGTSRKLEQGTSRKLELGSNAFLFVLLTGRGFLRSRAANCWVIKTVIH